MAQVGRLGLKIGSHLALLCIHCVNRVNSRKGAIKKHAIKLKTIPARLAQLLQPSLAFCFGLQPMTAHRPVRCHWLQAKTKCE